MNRAESEEYAMYVHNTHIHHQKQSNQLVQLSYRLKICVVFFKMI